MRTFIFLLFIALTGCYRPVYYPYDSGYGNPGYNYGSAPHPAYGQNYSNRHRYHDGYGHGHREHRRWQQYPMTDITGVDSRYKPSQGL